MDPQSPKTPTTPKGEDNQDNVSNTDLFDHIIFTVCQFFTKERADYLMKWMKYHGFENITHVISYMQTSTEESMNEVTQYKVNKQTHDLQGPTRQQIKLLAYWAIYKTNEIQDELSNSDWMNLTRREFNTWRINTDFSKGPPSQVPVSPMKSPSSAKSVSTVTAASQSQQDLTAFRKGTKRDAAAYEVFKDERYYDSFWRVFKTTAKAQGLSNVLNFKYTPPQDDEYAEELFQEQQVFLYSVLVRIIQTDQGRAYVREHEHDEDARAVLQKLHSLHTESDLAKREVLRLTNYISNLRLDDTWRGTTRQFLLHFQEQLRLLDNLVTLSDCIPDHTRMTFLMQAVEKVPDLRRVKILDNVVNTKSGAKSLCYQSYFRLLLDAAYDHDQATQSSVHSRRRHVKQHESLYGQDTDADITSQDDMEYHVHNTKVTSESPSSSSKVSLSRDLWFKLSEEDRKLIIEYNKMIQAPSSTTPRKVQTHALDIDPEPDPDPNQVASDDDSPGAVPEHPDDSDPVTQFINQAMTTDINHPATDLTSVLSNAKSKTSKKVTFKANMHKQEGHILHYLSSRKSTLPGNQLVDRGANGGLAGSDMRILSKTGRHITIVGIDNHELTGLPVVTCAAKFETNDGPIVGIFNEYAYYGKGLSIHAPGQFEHFGLAVDERSVKVDGKQRITTLDGRAIPLHIKDGLAYIHSLGIPSDNDMNTLPQIIFTSPDTWDPGVLDHSYSPTPSDNDPDWKHVKTDGSMSNHPYDNYGEYTDVLFVTSISFWISHMIMDLTTHPSFLSMLTQKVMILHFMPLSTVVTRKRMTGRSSVHSLVGNLKMLSTLHVMVALLLTTTPSRNISRLAIRSLIYLDVMNPLLLTRFSPTPLLLTMAVKSHKSLLVEILWLLISMGSSQPNSLSIPFRTTSGFVVPWRLLSVMVVHLSSLKRSKTFFALCLLGSIDPNLIINTRIRLKTVTRPSNV